MRSRLFGLFSAILVLAGGAAVQAANLPPGGSVALGGAVPPGGVIIYDNAIPFEILDQNTGGLLIRATLLDRVVKRPDGTLIFQRRIYDTLVDSIGEITLVQMPGYTDLAIDVNWDPTSPGFHIPATASRSGDGSMLTFDFTTNPIVETQESRLFYATTDALMFVDTIPVTIVTASGHSTTLLVTGPVIDDTPPDAVITQPTDLSCVCNPETIFGIADDLDGTYVSHTLEYRALNVPTWNLIGQFFVPVPAPGGPITSWDTTLLPQGYYFLRLTVENSAGLSSSAVTIVWVDHQFDVLNVTFPQNGVVYGGNVCTGGVLDDHCFEEWTVDFTTSGGGFWLPVDPNNPTYTGQKINQTFAVWDSTTVADGDYDIRVQAADQCGHPAEEIRTIIVDNTPPSVGITSPVNCAAVDGVVAISGFASDANLASWALQYIGGNANNWVTITQGTTNVGGLLANWDTTSLVPCAYALRLIASDSAILDCNGALHHHSEFMVTITVGDGTGCQGDVNGDGAVDTTDLLIVLGAWGMCP